MWEYQAQIQNVVDGDTYDALIDVGFKMQSVRRLRHAWLDTHEVYGPNGSEMGQEESAFVKQWIQEGRDEYDGDWPFIVTTEKTGSFGRWLATVERKFDGQMLGDAITNEFPERDIYYDD